MLLFLFLLSNSFVTVIADRNEFYLFFSSLFQVDLHLAYKKPINANNNTAYISVNKLLSYNDNDKTKYLIVR